MNWCKAAFCVLQAGIACAALASAAVSAPISQPVDGWIEANGTSLHYRIDRTGSHTPIILLHEMGTSLASWDEVVPLIAAGQPILRYDIRGFGLSEKLTGPITMAIEVADLEAILGQLPTRKPVVLIGSALGGAVALHFAAAHPEQVAGILAIGPAAYPDARPAVAAAADRIADAPMNDFIDGAIDVIYPAALRTPARMERFRGIQLATDPKSLARTSRMVGETATAPILPRITAPTWIAATTLFKGRAPESVAALASPIPHGTYVTLPTGHLAAIESPELTAALINRFLAEASPKTIR